MRSNGPDTSTGREEVLQKIIKNQEQIIQGLDTKLQNYKEKGLPEIVRLEQKLTYKEQEIESLQSKIKELQQGYNKERSILNQSSEKSREESEDLKETLKIEKNKHERRMIQLEDHYKMRISTLEKENQLVTEELVRLKSLYLKENDRGFSNHLDENLQVLDDLKKVNTLYYQKEAEHKEIIQRMKGKTIIFNKDNLIIE